MLTIAPLPCDIIGLAAAFDKCQTALKFSANTFSKSSSGHLRMDLVSAPPAQLTSTSSRPNSARVVSTRSRHASAVVTSVDTARARRPKAVTSLAVDSSGSGRRPANTTSAPCCAKTSAVPRPMPVPPPVMTATRPSSENRLFTCAPSDCCGPGVLYERIPFLYSRTAPGVEEQALSDLYYDPWD